MERPLLNTNSSLFSISYSLCVHIEEKVIDKQIVI